ncbi:SRPBCC family protein [Paenibacillus albus]|uniref:ATPase n=1 Tax=Paenibacillus albus TaxID=2495582 RepID=A0A3Q8X5V9_9BACL|nr:SRPBCC family protein [Paenibacillus albus]AZN39599.1 ATPase [Paenibacillus albus]
MTTTKSFVYTTYIATTPERLWEALTSGDFTEQYFFGSRIVSDWNEGSQVTYSRGGEVTDYGTIMKCEPNRLLSFTWNYVADKSGRAEPSRVTFQLVPMKGAVKLTLKHENLNPSDIVDRDDTFEGLNNGWPAILSNLKTLLETGRTLPPVSLH